MGEGEGGGGRWETGTCMVCRRRFAGDGGLLCLAGGRSGPGREVNGGTGLGEEFWLARPRAMD